MFSPDELPVNGGSLYWASPSLCKEERLDDVRVGGEWLLSEGSYED